MKKFLFSITFIFLVISLYIFSNKEKPEANVSLFEKNEKIISGDDKNKLIISNNIFKQLILKSEKRISQNCLVSLKEMLERTTLTLPEDIENCKKDFDGKAINLDSVEEGVDDQSKSTIFR